MITHSILCFAVFCLVSYGVIEYCDWNADWSDTP